MRNKFIELITLLLLVIGGINWLFLAVLNINILTLVFGGGLLSQIVYIAIGISAIYILFTKFIKLR